MDVFVPFDATDPKSRLASLFDAGERSGFARAMLEDVLAALDAAGCEPVVVSTAGINVDAPVRIDDRPLTDAVNGLIQETPGPVAIVVADLPLLSAGAIERLLAPDAPVVLAPGLGGGTNALVTRRADFRADYHGASIRDHRERAREIGVDPVAVDSFRLAVDVDEPVDLAEVILHGEGRAHDYLEDAGVTVALEGGRVGVDRS